MYKEPLISCDLELPPKVRLPIELYLFQFLPVGIPDESQDLPVLVQPLYKYVRGVIAGLNYAVQDS